MKEVPKQEVGRTPFTLFSVDYLWLDYEWFDNGTGPVTGLTNSVGLGVSLGYSNRV